MQHLMDFPLKYDTNNQDGSLVFYPSMKLEKSTLVNNVVVKFGYVYCVHLKYTHKTHGMVDALKVGYQVLK